MSADFDDMQMLPHTEGTMADYPMACHFLGLLSPDTAACIPSIPAWRFTPDDWAGSIGAGAIAALFHDREKQPIVMLQDGRQDDMEYNVCHEGLHAVLDEDKGLVRDYKTCELLPDTHRLLPWIQVAGQWRQVQEHYWMIHTLPLMEMMLWNSRSERTRERMAAYACEPGSKPTVLSQLRDVERVCIQGADLHQFSREIIECVICIAASDTALGKRFARILREIPDIESDTLTAYLETLTDPDDFWTGYRPKP